MEGGWITSLGMEWVKCPLSPVDGSPAWGLPIPWLEMHWWGRMLQTLRETYPFARWREGCKYGQEDKDACGDWCAWQMPGQRGGQSPSLQAGLRDLGHHEGQELGLGAGVKGCEIRLQGEKTDLKCCT